REGADPHGECSAAEAMGEREATVRSAATADDEAAPPGDESLDTHVFDPLIVRGHTAADPHLPVHDLCAERCSLRKVDDVQELCIRLSVLTQCRAPDESPGGRRCGDQRTGEPAVG